MVVIFEGWYMFSLLLLLLIICVILVLVKYMAALFRKQLNLSWVTDEDVQHAFGVLKTNGLGRGGRNDYIKIIKNF